MQVEVIHLCTKYSMNFEAVSHWSNTLASSMQVDKSPWGASKTFCKTNNFRNNVDNRDREYIKQLILVKTPLKETNREYSNTGKLRSYT